MVSVVFQTLVSTVILVLFKTFVSSLLYSILAAGIEAPSQLFGGLFSGLRADLQPNNNEVRMLEKRQVQANESETETTEAPKTRSEKNDKPETVSVESSLKEKSVSVETFHEPKLEKEDGIESRNTGKRILLFYFF